ncbi:MAG: GntR family transcriptional regulator [Planctomycetota bacterium]|nr:GntR family transcriptional regulator [Planctomycetota bacterium]
MKTAVPAELRKLRVDLRSGPAPRYALLSAALLSAIERGVWRTGDRLPTEEVLAASLPLSLGTIQRALRILVAQGILVRRHRSGTFVAARRLAMEQPWHCRFLNDDDTEVLPVYPKIVRRDLTRQRGAWSRHLGNTPAGVVRIDRVIDINAEFRVYSKFFVDAARFGSLLKRPLAQLGNANFKQILARDYHLQTLELAHTMSVLVLPRDAAAALELAPNTIGAVVEASATGARGVPIYFQQIFIPPNGRKLVVSDVMTEQPQRGAQAGPATGAARQGE